ncbi:MAG TPA: hypothetical protein VHW45_10620 [Candidatus Sulfotelmatobacter sp.]|jgi:hypothetical protein|nr:hypothetical protein [Candidatus Sulfotelmatobacter sp.]
MEAVAGVFKSRSDAEHALNALHTIGFPVEKTTFLTPGSADKIDKEMESVATDATEQPGMAKAMGALLGGSIGVTGGAVLMALVPGVGAITAFGLLGMAILGAAGATVGGAAADKVEEDSYQGLPEDEIFVYEDALRKGRSVVIALAENEGHAKQVRAILEKEGAESVDAAREQWWIGLRSAEQAHYSASGKNFDGDERFYRMGFEAALHAKTRCMEFDQVSGEMNAALEDAQSKYPGKNVEEAFVRGYQRGREHYQKMCDENTKAA